MTVLFTRAYAPRGGPPLHMRRQSIFGSAKSKTVALDGSSDTAGLMCLRRLGVASAPLILGGALLSACQPIPQSYYLAAGGGTTMVTRRCTRVAPSTSAGFATPTILGPVEATRVVSGPMDSGQVGWRLSVIRSRCRPRDTPPARPVGGEGVGAG